MADASPEGNARARFTPEQKAQLRERDGSGQYVADIARVLERRNKSGVYRILALNGRMTPAARRRAPVAFRLEECEEISRGIAAGWSIRRIARGFGKSPSRVSREVRRNGGCSAYRTGEAHTRALQFVTTTNPIVATVTVGPVAEGYELSNRDRLKPDSANCPSSVCVDLNDIPASTLPTSERISMRFRRHKKIEHIGRFGKAETSWPSESRAAQPVGSLYSGSGSDIANHWITLSGISGVTDDHYEAVSSGHTLPDQRQPAPDCGRFSAPTVCANAHRHYRCYR